MADALFEGIIVPLLMPLDEGERIIAEDLSRHVESLLAAGVAGFLVPSGTGEFSTLMFEERARAVEIVARVARRRALIISLTADCGVQNVLRLVDAAAAAGADAVMATPPYFSPVDQPTLRSFFTAIADQSPLPLWLYHQPAHTKIQIEPSTAAHLAEHPNIAGIKSSAWVDMFYYQQLLRALRPFPRFRVLMGEDVQLLSGLILGGHGAVSTLSNIIPEAIVGIWKATRAGDLETARRLQAHITDVEEVLLMHARDWQGALKFVLQRRGIFSSTRCARPSAVLSAEEKKFIENRAVALKLF